MSLVKRPWTPFTRSTSSLQDQAGQDHIIARPRIITYQELEERCQALEGYQDYREASNKKAEQDFRNGTSYQSLAIQQIQRPP